MVPIFMATL